MNDFLIYLLKVSAGTAIIYIVYVTIFSRDTFYLRNRILLILALLLPPVFPLLKIPVQASSAVEKIQVESIDSSVISNSIGPISGAGDTFDYSGMVMWIYFIISMLLLVRVIMSLVSTYRIIKKGEIVENQFPKVVVSEIPLPPFSFFSYAVIPMKEYRSSDYADILDHEFAHITQGHTFDLLLSELFISFQWFNPFAWFIKRSIVLNHEYLADHISIKNKSTIEYQYRLLNFQTGLRHVSLAHNFNSLIKNRIIMINKKRTGKYAALKNILILPAVAIIVYAFATPDYRYTDPVTNDITISINQPLEILQKEVFIRRTPDDFPTFQGEKPYKYTNWLIDNMQYPPEASDNGIGGYVSVKFIVAGDGSIENVVAVGNASPVLSDAVIRAIKASPKWEPAKNSEARVPFALTVRLKFELPGGIFSSEAFVVVEEMPIYPGGEEALVNFLTVNTNYPDDVKKEKIEGKVIVRFIVGASGDAEEPTVLKGVHPLLDEEAIRVVSMLKGFIPGKQGGQAVDVYYMVPVTFTDANLINLILEE